MSPRLRADLVVNSLVGYAVTTGEIFIQSDGSPWRPLVHVEDISRAFLAALEAPRDLIHNRAFNVGRTQENYQIREIADMVREVVPGSRVTYAEGGAPDPRCYRVNCDEIAWTLPAFQPRWTVRDGVRELYDAYRANNLTFDAFAGATSRYLRIQQLQRLLGEGRIDNHMRWTAPHVDASHPGSAASVAYPRQAHMKVVLFCGGLGMRIRDNENIPKPMMAIGYRPIMWHLMKYYAHFGFRDFILCLGYRADYIKNYFLTYNECMSNDFTLSDGGRKLELLKSDISDWRITFVDTGLNSNIGQRLKAVEAHLAGEDYFLANYSDGLSDLDLGSRSITSLPRTRWRASSAFGPIFRFTS